MRALAAATAAMTAILPLAVTSPQARAADDCQIAFEKWALLSSARVRTVAHDTRQGACLPSETARRSLLDALARTRRLCATSDPSTQQTRTLININQSFIASLDICRSEGGDTEPGWVTQAAPAPRPEPKVAAPRLPPEPRPEPQRRSELQPEPRPEPQPESKPEPKPEPKTAAPKPAPPAGPRPAVITPPREPTGGPRPTVIARPSPPPEPEAPAAPPPEPPCLEVSSAEAGRYAFVNRRCRGHAVIAVIETRNPYGKVACKGYEISKSLAIRASGNTPPRLNYECVVSRRRCNMERLGEMFPECDW